MIYIKIPTEIKDYKFKVFLGLTAKQLAYLLVGLILATITYFLGHAFLDDLILFLLVGAVVIVPFMYGFFSYDGLSSDEYARLVLKYYKDTRHQYRYDDGTNNERRKHVLGKKQHKKLIRQIKLYKKTNRF